MKNFKKDSAGGEAAGQKREGKGSEKNKLPITKPNASPARNRMNPTKPSTKQDEPSANTNLARTKHEPNANPAQTQHEPSANPVRGILISDGKTLSLRPVSQDVKNAEKAQKVVYL
mgnify:CR=1 FL=1